MLQNSVTKLSVLKHDFRHTLSRHIYFLVLVPSLLVHCVVVPVHCAMVMQLSMSSPRGGGGGGSGSPREFDCGVYPQGGDFDRTSCI